MTTSSSSNLGPVTQANHNLEASAFICFVDFAASPVLWFGESVSAICILLELFNVLDSSPQLDHAHGCLALACFVLHLCIHWRSHVKGHKPDSVITVAQAAVNENSTNLKT